MSGPDKQKKICQDKTEFCRDPTKQTKICQVLAKYFLSGFWTSFSYPGRICRDPTKFFRTWKLFQYL